MDIRSTLARIVSFVRPEARSGAQLPANVSISSFDTTSGLSNKSSATFREFREIRSNPTVALARMFVVAPVVMSGWGYTKAPGREDVPDEWVKFVRETMDPLRPLLLQRAMEGTIDFGWQPWEKVWGLDRKGRVVLRKLKPLLHDITTIMVRTDTGAFDGFKQERPDRYEPLRLEVERSLNIALRVEGTNWYGTSGLHPLINPHRDYEEARHGARRHMRKIAGGIWVIWYPPGTTLYKGKQIANDEIAEELLLQMQSSGMVKIPNSVKAELSALNKGKPEESAWSVELVESTQAAHQAFLDERKHNETLFARGLIVPERAMIQGDGGGTNAESQTQTNTSLIARDLEHGEIVRHVNWYVIDDLLEYNHGPDARGAVQVDAIPMVDEQKIVWRAVYDLILKNPTTAVDVFSTLDIDAMTEALGLPRQPDAEPLDLEKKQAEREQRAAEIAQGTGNNDQPQDEGKQQ